MATDQEVLPNPKLEETCGGNHTRPLPSETPGGTETPSSFDIELNLLKEVISGKHRWSKYIEENKNFEDVWTALKILYKYHPSNDGTHKKFPKATVGDVQDMREDLMHLSSLNCYLAAQAAMYETSAENLENERTLCRHKTRVHLRRSMRNGEITERLTQEDMRSESEASTENLYRLEYELKSLGRMYSWVRASVRSFVESLGILIQSSMREERADSKLQ